MVMILRVRSRSIPFIPMVGSRSRSFPPSRLTECDGDDTEGELEAKPQVRPLLSSSLAPPHADNGSHGNRRRQCGFPASGRGVDDGGEAGRPPALLLLCPQRCCGRRCHRAAAPLRNRPTYGPEAAQGAAAMKGAGEGVARQRSNPAHMQARVQEGGIEAHTGVEGGRALIPRVHS